MHELTNSDASQPSAPAQLRTAHSGAPLQQSSSDEMDVTPQTTWRERLRVHPAADLFPLMSEAALEQLTEDIETNGIQVPIVLLPNGQLTDGRNRLDAAERAGLRIFEDHGD